MSQLRYPLEQLIIIKKNRFDQAVKTLEEKKKILEQAYEKLYDLTQERDEIAKHKEAKLKQIHEAFDEGASMPKIQQMKIYLKTVQEKLEGAQKKVVSQKREVDVAQTQVDKATEELFARKKDLEKLEIHRGEWEKEVRYFTERQDAIEGDELGSASFTRKKLNQQKP